MATDPQARELRELKRRLAKLSDVVLVALDQIDRVMRQSETEKRGRDMARIANWLDLHNDSVRHFLLDKPIDEAGKRKALAAAKKKYLKGQA